MVSFLTLIVVVHTVVFSVLIIALHHILDSHLSNLTSSVMRSFVMLPYSCYSFRSLLLVYCSQFDANEVLSYL